MSQSMPIPQRKQPVRNAAAASWSSSSTASSYSNPNTMPVTPSLAKGKFPATPPRHVDSISPRRPSLLGMSVWGLAERVVVEVVLTPSLGSSLSKSEYTVMDLGHDDGPPRLVTYVKSSQGFDWNQELFLPSYADYDSQELETRQDPVEDIVLTDEEAAAMLPQ
ncbi:hypothetical protein LTS14_003572 [Recurvomyces mirabilis]|uniref:uncharacterized protein n=1 Tax=Recurvomyces mirabilis TaxID=574656 RepID=UPI002DE09C7B|nr:hypothetical protein LTS14_003572 [Recurvomyces mirabilis]